MASTPTGTQDAPNPAPTGPKKSKWVKYLGSFALGGAILAIVIAFVALTLARYDMVDKITGFFGFVMMLNPARALAVIAAIALVLSFIVKSGPRWQAIGGLVLSGALLLTIYTQVIIPGGEAKPIHDITTDMDDTPQFVVLDRPETSTGPFSIEEWRAFHTSAYSHIAPIVIDKSPVDVLADARALVEERGWEIALVDPATGHLEATATAGYLRFYDDVIVEVTPIEDGSSRVDMRSVSQVGVSDLGYNAKRIEAFLADLAAI